MDCDEKRLRRRMNWGMEGGGGGGGSWLDYDGGSGRMKEGIGDEYGDGRDGVAPAASQVS